MRFCLVIHLIMLTVFANAQNVADCNNWVNLTTRTTFGIQIGDLAITGQHLTIEAEINASIDYTNAETGDIVSKHRGAEDCNYLLRPDRGQITLMNGVHYQTPVVCPIVKGKTYHVAMTYDGKQLIFYRNGIAMSSIACSGDLIQNGWTTTIGNLGAHNSTIEAFDGYINEVRIWNVTRTPAEISAYMTKSLPSPTTQLGLLAYYRFSSLKNLQGNSAYDATFSEAIVYPATVPSCDFANGSCAVPICQSYAKVANPNNGFRAGDIDISGDQLTVEATINSLGPFPNSGTVFSNTTYAQDIVSKHDGYADANYLLRINHAEITTTNGFYKTDEVCNLPTNQTFHLAMVYNGSSLKFYRNGELLSEKACKGNLVLNNWITTIGAYASQHFSASSTQPEDETFNGYINEVRIWNVARSQSELDQYKDQPLPNPTTQTGLVAYYQFNDLKNKQGNANYDLQLLGTPQINQTNPSCELGTEPCPKCMLTASFDVKSDICNPAHFSFANTTPDVTTYQWQFGDNTIPSATTETADAIYKAAGTYNISLKVSDNKGCTAAASKSVTASLLPKAIKTDAATICKGQTLQLESNVNEVGAKYAWSPQSPLSDPSIENPIATMNESTLFTLTVTRSNSCVETGSVQITVPAVAVFSVSSADISVCAGSNVTLTAMGGDVYLWKNSEGEIVGTTPTINPNTSISDKYILDVSSTQCGEKATFSSSVNIFPVNEFSITASNTIDCAHTSARLSIKDAQNVQWQSQDGLIADGQSAIISPKTTTTYFAKVEDQYGCFYNTDYTQNVGFDPSGVHFFVPTAFTPNGDGKNDIFRIRTDIALNKYSLRIFNRYGQLVFQTQNQEAGWDGRLKKELQPTGTYIFEVVANSNFCGEYYKKGTVVLIR